MLVTSKPSGRGVLDDVVHGIEGLASAVQRLSLARSLDEVQAVVRSAARHLTGADGATFVLRDGDQVYRTYFIDSRGDEHMGSTWSYLDITALGRQEEWEDSPEGYPQTPPYQWWRLHDEYEPVATR